MFGLSTWEILIILVLALLFIGPDELPKMANKLGKGLRQVRGAMSKVDDEVRKTVREFQAEAARLAEDEEANGKPRAPGDPIAASPDGTPQALPEPPKEAAGAEQAVVPERAPRDLGSLAAKTSINARDWSQIGKGPVEGRVATVLPGRPSTASMAPAAPEAAGSLAPGSETDPTRGLRDREAPAPTAPAVPDPATTQPPERS